MKRSSLLFFFDPQTLEEVVFFVLKGSQFGKYLSHYNFVVDITP